MFRGICNHEVQDALIGLKLNKSFMGTPPKCIKLACNFISEPLSYTLQLIALARNYAKSSQNSEDHAG